MPGREGQAFRLRISICNIPELSLTANRAPLRRSAPGPILFPTPALPTLCAQSCVYNNFNSLSALSRNFFAPHFVPRPRSAPRSSIEDRFRARRESAPWSFSELPFEMPSWGSLLSMRPSGKRAFVRKARAFCLENAGSRDTKNGRPSVVFLPPNERFQGVATDFPSGSYERASGARRPRTNMPAPMIFGLDIDSRL